MTHYRFWTKTEDDGSVSYTFEPISRYTIWHKSKLAAFKYALRRHILVEVSEGM